jgi:putative spermidine/putrescine transport system permease protein
LDAAATLGAGPAYRFWKVILPLSSPGIVAGAAIVFSMAISAYVIPSLLTGAGYKTMSKVIANAFLVIHNPALGSTVGVMLLFLSGAVVLIGGAAAARMGKG